MIALLFFKKIFAYIQYPPKTIDLLKIGLEPNDN